MAKKSFGKVHLFSGVRPKNKISQMLTFRSEIFKKIAKKNTLCQLCFFSPNFQRLMLVKDALIYILGGDA